MGFRLATSEVCARIMLESWEAVPVALATVSDALPLPPHPPPFSVESPRTVSNRDGILKPQPRNGLFHRDYYIQIIMNVNNFSILQILLLFQFYVFSPWTFQGGYLKLPFAPVLFLCIFILYISHHSLPRFPMVGQFSLSTCPLCLFCSAGKGSWNFVFFLAQK